ncbi:hypothetical protein DD598_29295, partial [Enterobacter cloacae complex sp. 2DZ2F16B1]
METKPKEVLHERILDLQRLELDREESIDHYITKATSQRDKINKKLKGKGLKEGMLVLRYDNRLEKTFLQRWEGPFMIKTKFGNGSYRLADLSGKLHKTTVNGWRLKPYFQRINPLIGSHLPTLS